MENGEVFGALRDVLVEKLKVDADRVKSEAKFFEDLGLDSIDLATAVMAIEERFGIEVSDKELEKVSTLDDAVQILSSKVTARA